MTQAVGIDSQLRQRLDREVEHFEELYAQEVARGLAPLSDFDKRRYTAPPASTIFPREYFYHLLSPLEGKDTLEIACGNGIDACLCAHNRANVHAYDLSSQSTKMVRQRAGVNDLGDRIKLQVTGNFADAFGDQKFDCILGYAALHHIPYQEMAQQIYDRLKPGGVAVFAEPVINAKWLAALRRCVPYYMFKPTEDEQPLNIHDIAQFSQPFDRVTKRYFQLSSRMWPLFPNNWPLALGLHKLDSYLLRVPSLWRLATVCVFGLYRDR